MKISIIDYGINNIFSIYGAIEKIGYKPTVVKNPLDLSGSDKIILPGVGAFSAGMKALKQNKFDLAIIEEVSKGIPILGICLGLQMFFLESNEFGLHSGLGLINGKVKIIKECDGYISQKLPNTGWRKLQSTTQEGMFKDYSNDKFLYFIHSYYIEPDDNKIITSRCLYEGLEINASIQKDNIFGVQFHPEKSGDIGLTLLKNFFDY